MRVILAERGRSEPISLGGCLATGKKVRPDVTEFLQEDHRTVLAWFDWHAAAQDASIKRQVAAAIAAALRAHMAVEEEIFYPAAAQATGKAEELGFAREEHEQAKAMLTSLELAPLDDAAAAELKGAIRGHVEHEEAEIFPLVRASNLDLYAIGAACAARRLEVLIDCTGKNLALSEDVTEVVVTPISTESAQRNFVLGLRDIHAAIEQGRVVVEAQANRLENYPVLQARLRQHLNDKLGQRERVERILGDLDASRSILKDSAMAAMGGFSNLAASMAGDGVIKASLALAALANFEAASYEVLLSYGEAAGAKSALPSLQQCLAEERAMIAFLNENLRPTSIRFLALQSSGATASH